MAALPASTVPPQPSPLRITVVDIVPWAGLNASGQPNGVVVDLVTQLSQASGVAIAIISYGRAAQMLTGSGAEK
jgi:hypothetical protein